MPKKVPSDKEQRIIELEKELAEYKDKLHRIHLYVNKHYRGE